MLGEGEGPHKHFINTFIHRTWGRRTPPAEPCTIYQAEEAALRERLKVVTKVRQNLESAAGKVEDKRVE